jgi:hypothetical protein
MKPRFLSSGRFRSLLFGLTEGVLVAALVVNVRDALRENAFYREIAARTVGDAVSTEDQLLALLKKSYGMVTTLREGIEDGSVEDISGLAGYRRMFLDSVTHDALFPTKNCGSYSGMFVELLKARKIPTRFVQMLDRDDVSGVAHHIVVEAWLDGRWVICDPMYDLVFRGDDGRILGFDEIRRDWDRLQAQCPPGYDLHYDYRGSRRVNFGRLNPWLQKTFLAEWAFRHWLNERAWMRSGLVASLLAFVVAIHVWFERSGRIFGAGKRTTLSAAAGAPESPARVSPRQSIAGPARSASSATADR